jgi:superfamily II DNA or RNA helicase
MNKNNVEFPQNIDTYLGSKGYTVLKKDLPMRTQLYIKDQLSIKPYTPGAPISAGNSFPCYRESNNKLYLPRYYGIELFGTPKRCIIPDGETTHLQFNGSLRDYQVPVIEKTLEYLRNNPYSCGLLELYCAWGKTTGALHLISNLLSQSTGVKTLIIVHKEFLMNQWIERIQQFIPNARIGKIQGMTVDIEDKDIVLCMLQSLVLKDYPSEIFNSFGLTIIDEVHHISSETFSTALFKVVTKHMIGLSATMDRKDGTTNAFKMFLGNVIHKAERKTTFEVEIRGIKFLSNDEEYNETITAWDGKPQISSMISKVCEYSRRTEFIIDVIKDFIRKNDTSKEQYIINKQQMDNCVPNCEICGRNNNYLMKNSCCECVKYCMICLKNIRPELVEVVNKKTGEKQQTKKSPKCPNCNKALKFEQNYIENPDVKPIQETQSIILAHNLNILEYIYDKFVCKNLASVGYYVGGMKEIELKKSENKQVILATYAMANEGLDIATLNAEFLITPKTDVVQTIGRVLRAKHAINDPIIYDIYDAHEVFTRQWSKRKSYYKKQGYKIVETDSDRYQRQQWRITCQSKIIEDEEKEKNITREKNKINKKNTKSEKNIINEKNTTSEKNKKNITRKSNSSSERSLAEDTSSSDEDEYEEERQQPIKSNKPRCLLNINLIKK